MSTVNEPDHTDHTGHVEHPEEAPSIEGAGAAKAEGTDPTSAPATTGRDERDTAAEQPAAAADDGAEGTHGAEDPVTARTETAQTSVYVRRGRTPTLGFWVAVAIALPAVAALVSAPFFHFADLGGVLNFVLLAAVIVGLPLATIAAVIDSVRHRRKSSPQR